MTSSYNTARQMVQQGYAVLQLKDGDKAPLKRGWRKPNSSVVARTTEDIDQWSGRYNVGVLIEPGFFVLDVDGEEGRRQLKQLEKKFGRLPATRTIKTTGGGWHYYFEDGGYRITNSNKALAQALGGPVKIDVRGVGGQVVAPGCTVNYESGPGTSKVLRAKMVRAPDWLLELLAAPEPQESVTRPISEHDYQEVARALRHVVVASYDEWVRIGMALHTTGRDDAFELFDAWSKTQYGYQNEDDCLKHWSSFRSNGELVRYPTIFHSAKESGWKPSAPVIQLPRLVELGEQSIAETVVENPSGYSDDTLAIRVANVLGGNCRYVRTWQYWYAWNGTKWARDEDGEAVRLVREVLRKEGEQCQELGAQFRKAKDVDKQKCGDKLIKLAYRLGQTKTLNDVMKQLVVEQRESVEVAASPWIWDTGLEILNTPDGAYDLRTCEKVEACRELYCTKSTEVAPDFSPPPRFMKFLDEIFQGCGETIDFFHRYLGYAATGYTREQCMVVAYGEGRNGKSVLFKAIGDVLGSGYAKIVSPDIFTADGARQHKSNIAALVGKRFVLSQEPREGAQWNEGQFKALVSGERVEANHMRGEKFEFEPQGSIVICANDAPEFKVVDEAIRGRLRFVEFKVCFRGREDRLLSQKLSKEWPQILGWLMLGAKKYLADGLPMPAGVQLSTDVYLEKSDTLRLWLDDVILSEDELKNEREEERHWHTLVAIMANYNAFTGHMRASGTGRGALTKALGKRGISERARNLAKDGKKLRRYWGPLKLPSLR